MELRKDYILDRWVVIAEKRKLRPKQFKKSEIVEDSVCFFCPGNEETTPPEIGRVEYKGGWKIRWFPNKFPVVEMKGTFKLVKNPFLHSDAYGSHEVIAETPDHKKQMHDLSIEELKDVFKVYQLRIKELSKQKNAKYVVVFKNHGREAGTSLVHSHTQILSYPKIPGQVLEEVNVIKKFGKCPYCGIIQKEMKSARKIMQNKTFACFAPYASRFNYEAWIFPKKHLTSFLDFNDKELLDLAEIMKKILTNLAKINASYNFVLHYAPNGSDLHLHIEILPRIAVWAGFELSTGEIINSVSPESAAKFYRGR